MTLRTLQSISCMQKRVLVRVDFNVPLKNGVVTDDARIRAAIPTIEAILRQAPQYIVLLTHVGRPQGERVAELSVKPIAKCLKKLLKREVVTADDCIGPQTHALLSQAKRGSVILLENLRFHEQEVKNDPTFSAQLAGYGDVFVNDAFGTAHRAHASTVGITEHIPSVAGLLIEKEISYLRPVLNNPQRPIVAIIGGAKVSSKIGVLSSLVKKVDRLIVGGGMAYTFLKAQGYRIGDSLFEPGCISVAEELLRAAKDSSHLRLILPSDHLIVPTQADSEEETETTMEVHIPNYRKAVDIGPQTVRIIADTLKDARTVFWNGPMGIFEIDNYAQGTLKVAQLLARCEGTTIVGGGDSVAAINKFGLGSEISHISTGGGASMEYIEGKTLPGIAVLEG